MPFSFSKLCLGKKATVVDENALPCRPRSIVPTAAESPIVTKAKFDLTKIGRTLKQKLRINAPAPVPAGHRPLILIGDQSISPTVRRAKSPATVGLTRALPSLPYIPRVSSTLGREIGTATRSILLATTCGANSEFANDNITDTPWPRRRSRSSSTLGATDLPRPQRQSYVQTSRAQYQGIKPDILPASSLYVDAPGDSLLGNEDDSDSSYTSEYTEPAALLPLGVACRNELPSYPPYIGLARSEIVHPVPQRGWYTQQYVETAAKWSMPITSPSYLVSTPHESYPGLPNLMFESHTKLPGSSVYSPFKAASSSLSTTRSHITTYSPIKAVEKAEFLQEASHTSPPATSTAREAHEDDTFKSSFTEGEDHASANEAVFHDTKLGFHNTAHATPLQHSDQLRLREPTVSSVSDIFVSAAEADTQDEIFEDASDGSLNDNITSRAVSSGTVLIHRPQSNRSHSRQNSLVLSQLAQYAPEAAIRLGPERRVQVNSFGPSRVIAGCNLFAAKQQHGYIDSASDAVYSSSTTCRSPETIETHGRQPSSTKGSSLISDNFLYSFTQKACKSALKGVPTMGDILHSHTVSSASPRTKQINFAEARRMITLTGTITAEYGAICNSTDDNQDKQVTSLVNKVSELQDLKDNWYENDQDLLHIGEHVTGFEIQQEEIHRENATKDAITCLQTRLVSAAMKLAELESTSHSLNSCEHGFALSRIRGQLQHAMKCIKSLNKIILSQYIDIDEVQITVDNLRIDFSELEAEIAIQKDQILQEQENVAVLEKKYDGLENAFELRRKDYMDTAQRAAELSKHLSVLKAREEASKIVFDHMITDKLVEIAMKDRKLETLRQLCSNKSVASELAELHKALRESRNDNLEILQQCEEVFKFLKRVGEGQAEVEHEIQTANIARDFAEINQPSVEELSGEHGRAFSET